MRRHPRRRACDPRRARRRGRRGAAARAAGAWRARAPCRPRAGARAARRASPACAGRGRRWARRRGAPQGRTRAPSRARPSSSRRRESLYGARSARASRPSSRSASSTRCSTSARSRPQVQRAEGDLVAHGRIEELHVGTLEDDPDAPAEGLRLRLVLEQRGGERRAEGAHLAARRLRQPRQQLQQRRFAGAVGAEQRKALALGHGEAHTAERDDAIRVVEGDVVEVEDWHEGSVYTPAVAGNSCVRRHGQEARCRTDAA